MAHVHPIPATDPPGIARRVAHRLSHRAAASRKDHAGASGLSRVGAGIRHAGQPSDDGGGGKRSARVHSLAGRQARGVGRVPKRPGPDSRYQGSLRPARTARAGQVPADRFRGHFPLRSHTGSLAWAHGAIGTAAAVGHRTGRHPAEHHRLPARRRLRHRAGRSDGADQAGGHCRIGVARRLPGGAEQEPAWETSLVPLLHGRPPLQGFRDLARGPRRLLLQAARLGALAGGHQRQSVEVRECRQRLGAG